MNNDTRPNVSYSPILPAGPISYSAWFNIKSSRLKGGYRANIGETYGEYCTQSSLPVCSKCRERARDPWSSQCQHLVFCKTCIPVPGASCLSCGTTNLCNKAEQN